MAGLPTFTHLLNPFRAKPGTENDIAQRLTFASIRTAIEYAKPKGVDVEVLAVCYAEDVSAVEPPAKLLPLLTRSVQDIKPMTPVRKFPLLVDLLKPGFEHGTGEYLIHTNIDIALQPFFYYHVARIIRRYGKFAPAFLINRREVLIEASEPADLPRLYANDGQPHLGYDCFVFPRAWVPDLELGNLCIGTHLFDSTLFALLDARSGYRTRCFARQRLTIHLGETAPFSRNPYMDYNEAEAKRVMAAARAKLPAPPPPRSEFSVRDLLITHGKWDAPRPSLIPRLCWRFIEETSRRTTRRLLADYLRTLKK